MNKQMVVLTGSPRSHGNSNSMAAAFMKKAEAYGYEIERFDTAKMDIGFCTACYGCKETAECVKKDDFQKIASAIEKADAVIFVMPLYWYSIPGQMKAVIDRFQSLAFEKDRLVGKKCALIACCADEGVEKFDGIVIPYRKILEKFQWESAGELLVNGLYSYTDIAQTDACERAERFAAAFEEK